MKSYRTVVSSKGQVVIPAELREQYGLDKGTPATWTEEEGRLVLTPMTMQRIKEIRGFLKPGAGRAFGILRSCSQNASASANERTNDRCLSRGRARRYVLDANALIGFFEDREGTAGKIEHLLERGPASGLATLDVGGELG